MNGPRTTNAAPGGQTAALQAALAAERAERAGAERSLTEAQTAIRALQAKLAHADALAAERRAREQAETALREAMAAREGAERRLDEAAARASMEASAPRTTVKRAKAGKPAPKTSAAKGREPKPVKWWLPGYKATTKAP